MVQLSTPGVTPNRGMGPPLGAFCQITLTSCSIETHCSRHHTCTYATKFFLHHFGTGSCLSKNWDPLLILATIEASQWVSRLITTKLLSAHA